jgi:hypothetical protein
MVCRAMRSSGSLSAFLFFVAWVLVGKFTLLSLFLAVIMEAFEHAHEKRVAERTAIRSVVEVAPGSFPICCD